MPPRASALIVSLAAAGTLVMLPAAGAPRNPHTTTPSPTSTASATPTPSASPEIVLSPSAEAHTPSAMASPSSSGDPEGRVAPEGKVNIQRAKGKPGGGGGTGFVLDARVRPATDDDVQHTYREGCPVGPGDLQVLEVNHWNYDGQVDRGVLVLRTDAVDRTVRALQMGADAGFPIFQMRNPDEYGGDDETQMEANNSSAFNCRTVVDNPLAMSPHSYGRAVDFNPVQNPYKSSKGNWFPEAGEIWQDRSLNDPGMLFKATSLTRGMTRNGYTWGGTWVNPDYQHFQIN